MKSASLKEIKASLENLSNDDLISLITRLSKFKKENKELITYVLFEETNEELYVQSVKDEMDILFKSLNTDNIYFAKKNIRKIIRIVNRYIKYSEQKTTEVALLIHACKKIKESGLNLDKSQALTNIYFSLLKRINKAVDSMHEDLQFDFNKELANINIF